MPFVRPTLAELKTRIEADFESRLTLEGAPLRRAIVKILARVLAGAVHLLFGFLDWISRQMLPTTAEETGVKRWGSLFTVTPTPAAFATGTVTLTGTNGLKSVAGELLVRSDGKEFTIDADVTIASGTGTASVTAVTADEDSNCDVGVSLTFESPVSGVDPTATVIEISGGSDAEELEPYRSRVVGRIQDPPHGGTEADYEAWAKEVSGVTRAWANGGQLGAGTVVVYFVRDNDVSIIPDSGEVAAVQSYIDAKRPVTADVTVAAPTALAQALTISITPDNTATRAAVQAELDDLWSREAEPGGTILHSQIEVAIGTAEGVTDFTLTTPAGNVTTSTGEISTRGTVTWV